MTVAGQITDERLVELMRWVDNWAPGHNRPDFQSAITELQHRRAGSDEALTLIRSARERFDQIDCQGWGSPNVPALRDAFDLTKQFAADGSRMLASVIGMIEASRAASPSPPASGVRVKAGIYVASKVAHAEMWRDLRTFEKMPIISTWIDELYPEDMDGLWQRCISEASNAQAFLILRRPEEVLKGAWIELGAALASGVPVYAVGIEEFTVAKDKRIRHFPNLVEARAAIRSALGEHP